MDQFLGRIRYARADPPADEVADMAPSHRNHRRRKYWPNPCLANNIGPSLIARDVDRAENNPMKVVILAGGFGTRLSEETSTRPKPMVEIGGKPLLWHIMKFYGAYGFTDFVVLGGYKVEHIRNYLMTYRQSTIDFTIDLASGQVVYHREEAEPWRVTVLDT